MKNTEVLWYLISVDQLQGKTEIRLRILKYIQKFDFKVN